MSRTRTVFETGLREYARTPVLLALLVFLPAYVIAVFARVVPDQRVPVEVAGQGIVRVGMKAATATLMTPVVAALVGGIAGLFLMQSAREVDARLAIVGTRAREILLARGGVLVLAALLASVVSVGVMSVTYVPENVGWFLVATALVGLLYGGLGATIGLVLSRLGGVYLLMFGPLIDLFLAQSPLAEGSPAVAPYLPGHYPAKLAHDAAFTAGVDLANLVLGLLYLSGVALVTGLAFYRTLGTG